MIDVACPRCNAIYHADPAHAGKYVKCTHCGCIVPILDKKSGPNREQLESLPPPKSPFRISRADFPAGRAPPVFWIFAAAFVMLVLALVISYHYRGLSSARSRGTGDVPPAPTQTVADTPPEPVQNFDFQPESSGQPGGLDVRPEAHELEADRRPLTYNSLPTGTRIEEDIGTDGHGKLTVENGTREDAVARLSDATTEQTVRGFFVKAGSSARMTEIPAGSYQLLYTIGLDWSDAEDVFRWHPSYAKFERILEYSEQRNIESVRYHEIKVTLHAVLGGNARTTRISREEFLKGHRHVSLSR